MRNLITTRFNDSVVSFHVGDAFVNLTQMCKPFKKLPNEFLRLASTKAFIKALEEDLSLMRGNPASKLVDSTSGRPLLEYNNDSLNLVVTDRTPGSAGSWAHPDLAIECARWLSPKFAIWCNRVIRCILSGQTLPEAELPAQVWGFDAKRRQVIEDRLGAVNAIAKAPSRQKRATILAIAAENPGRRGFSPERLYSLYAKWHRQGRDWRVLDLYVSLRRH